MASGTPRRVLIVSPHFPPINAADHQRVRMALPYLQEFGWKATVLAVSSDAIEGMPVDPLLNGTVPDDIEVIRTKALPVKATRAFGLGSLAMRSLPFLYNAGDRLLKRGRRNAEGGFGEAEDRGRKTDANREGKGFDLVFFSTTQFPVMSLGPRWKKKFGVPYVVDMQDPWLDDYYERTNTRPPGGKLKYNLSRYIARRLEPKVMRDVAHVISVSPSYVDTLRERYAHLRSEDFTVLPFGAPQKDFELLSTLQVKQTIFTSHDGKQHWVYVGAAGRIMETALRLLFSALAQLRAQTPGEWSNVHLHFAGTSYAPAGRAIKTVEPIAREFGLDDIVTETTDRQPYFETLQALTETDALLVIGSDSPSYSASKLYPYILAKKPMLSILHQDSPAVAILKELNGGELVTFNPADAAASREQMMRALNHLPSATSAIRNPQSAFPPDSSFHVPRSAFQKYTAREMTRKLCAVFDDVVSSSR